MAWPGIRRIAFIQTNAEFLRKCPDQRAIATLYYLWARFENKFIYADLDDHTCRKAGVSQRQLRRYLSRLRNAAGMETLCKPIGKNGHFAMITGRFIKGRYRDVLNQEPTKARCTITIRPNMSVWEIQREIRKKVFQHKNAQIRKAKEGGIPNGTALKMASKQYPVHTGYSQSTVKPTEDRHHAPMPADATSAFLRCSERTFWRDVKMWEAEGSIVRVRRRVSISAPPPEWTSDPVGFREKFGAGVFVGPNGCWYMQMSNLYFDATNYSGPNSILRRDGKWFGAKTSEMLTGRRK